MLRRLAWQNIRHSVRDYTIYFFTLLLGVAVFYAFNSIGAQQVIFDLESQASTRMFDTTQAMLGMFSGLIACVLGFLILYSNGFLIKRRKREFGTYMLLGMSAGDVSRIMLLETAMVGFLSLVLGLVAGFLLSQGMSFVTASLFGTTITHYQFVFSPEAFVLTIICFVIIYVVVAIFNTFTVNRNKLIDLLNADARNQRVAVRNPWICLVVFIISVAIIVYAYQQLVENGLVMLDDPCFYRATIGMLVGTFLFFWSLAGFVIAILTHLRGVYLRGLIPFTVRQIASRVNTAFISLWAVCVMLFFSVTVFSIGMGMVESFTGGIEEANPYSATMRAEVFGEEGTMAGYDRSNAFDERARAMQAASPERFAQAQAYDWNMATPLEEGAPELWDETVAASAQVNIYAVPGLTYGDLCGKVSPQLVESLRDLHSTLANLNMEVVSLADLNAQFELVGRAPLALEPGQCALLNNMDISRPIAQSLADAQVTFDTLGQHFQLRRDVVEAQLEDSALASTALIFVMPDAYVADLKGMGVIPAQSYLNVMYADNGKTAAENEQALAEIIAATQPLSMDGFDKGYAGSDDIYASLLWPVTNVITAEEMITQSGGLKMLITYLALYIGFVFLISTAAILAVQQLSQTADSLPRYRMLSRIGCSQRSIFRSLLVQVLIYFMLPLGLALCHAACAVTVASGTIFDALGVSVLDSVLMSIVLVAVVYGGYMAITYFTSRGTVKGAMKAS